jgi:murein DD-endopeptidase MepM/ murein hydrolase activator NlpD
MCEGPRRVPLLEGEALERARTLGLLSPAVRRLLVERPRDAWVAAVGSAPASDVGWPVDGGRVWRGFGMHAGIVVRHGHATHTGRQHPHDGVDIGASRGTAILAANDGLVAYSDNGLTGYGNAVLIVHADATVTLYGHCVATFVVAGQHVARGEVIAAVGDTGLAHGAHLHFELHEGGVAVDPMPRIAAPTPIRATDAPPAEPAEDREELDEP